MRAPTIEGMDELHVVPPDVSDDEIEKILDRMKEYRAKGERTFIVTSTGRKFEILDGCDNSRQLTCI